MEIFVRHCFGHCHDLGDPRSWIDSAERRSVIIDLGIYIDVYIKNFLDFFCCHETFSWSQRNELNVVSLRSQKRDRSLTVHVSDCDQNHRDNKMDDEHFVCGIGKKRDDQNRHIYAQECACQFFALSTASARSKLILPTVQPGLDSNMMLSPSVLNPVLGGPMRLMILLQFTRDTWEQYCSLHL